MVPLKIPLILRKTSLHTAMLINKKQIYDSWNAKENVAQNKLVTKGLKSGDLK